MRLQQTKHALGSTVFLTVIMPSKQAAESLLAELWDTINTFEQRFSRFRNDSELTLFNQRAGTMRPVSPEFLALLSAVKAAAMNTGGLYNPFILPALQQAGYVGSWPEPSKADNLINFSSRTVHDSSALIMTKDAAQIPADAALDFGGIGKGYLLDVLAGQATGSASGFWFSLGGDLICQGFDEAGQPWELSVQAAQHGDRAVATVINHDGNRLALATSGITKRRGTTSKGTWNHLIDPRTGLSAVTDILTASVIGKDATTADVYASCLVVLGQKKAKLFLQQHNLSGLLQLEYGTANSQNIVTVGDGFKL